MVPLHPRAYLNADRLQQGGSCLSNQNVNIAFMRLFREGKGKTAYSVVESDERIPDEILEEIRQNPYVQEILLIQI